MFFVLYILVVCKIVFTEEPVLIKGSFLTLPIEELYEGVNIEFNELKNADSNI